MDTTWDRVLAQRRSLDFGAELERRGWYHSMELPGGRIAEGILSLDQLRGRYAEFGLPEDLTGKRVLDVGAWDGWFSFEAERHGADTVAVDVEEVDNFLYTRREWNSRVRYEIASVYELPERGLGKFDYVLFLGVLYHLRHPLLGLEIVCGLTRQTALVDSYIVDGVEAAHVPSALPWMEFYETDELGGNIDNWVGPTLNCLHALCRAAGFARTELLSVWHRHARLACHRQWEPEPGEPAADAPIIQDALHNRNFGINFNSRKDEYLSVWFESADAELTRDQLRLEVGCYGAPALWLGKQEGAHWSANFRLPPGLDAGWHDVRLRTAGSRFGEPRRIAVDMPVRAETLSIDRVCDGIGWEPGRMRVRAGRSHLCAWVGGLAENADRSNVSLWMGEVRMRVEYVGPADHRGLRQVNGSVAVVPEPGRHELKVRHGGREADIFIEIAP